MVASAACAESGLDALTAPPAAPTPPIEEEPCPADLETWRFRGVLADLPAVRGPRVARTRSGATYVFAEDVRPGQWRVATDAPGTWVEQTIDLGTGPRTFGFGASESAFVIAASELMIERIDLALDGSIAARTPLPTEGAPSLWVLDVALDSDDALHVVYSDYDESGGGFGMPTGGLRYLSDASGVWVDLPIDATPGPAAIDVDVNGSASVVFTSANELRVGAVRAGVIAIEVIAMRALATASLALASDEDALHVAAVGADGELEHLVRGAGGWTSRVVASNVTHADVSLDDDGDAHFAWVLDDGALRFDGESPWPDLITGRVDLATRDGARSLVFYDYARGAVRVAGAGACRPELDEDAPSPAAVWSHATIAPPPDWATAPRFADTAATVDADGALHVAFAYRNAGCCGDLVYATNGSGAWRTEPIASDGHRYGLTPAIAIHAGGVLAAYRAVDGVYLARRDASGWTTERIDAETPAAGPALLGPNEILYGKQSALMRAVRVDGTWRTERLDEGGPGFLLNGVRAAGDSDGHTHVAFVDHYGDVRYATDTSGAWQVDVLGRGYGAAAIRLVDDAPQIVFGGEGWLQLAEPSTEGWDRDLLDVSTIGPESLAVSVVAEGTLGVAVDGWPSRGVTFVEAGDDARWHRELIALDGSNAVVAATRETIHVVYFDYATRAIRVASRPRE